MAGPHDSEGNGYGPSESSSSVGPSRSLLNGGGAGSIPLSHLQQEDPSYFPGPSTGQEGLNGQDGTYTPRRRSSQSHKLLRGATRSWRPLACITLPFLLVLVYSFVHPHVDVLPPLPKISIHTGSSGLDLRPANQQCICSSTGEGERLCSVYGEEGLKRSRLFNGSGARTKRMLGKAKLGVPLKVGILGGSVSACHGAHPDIEFPQGDPNGPGCYPVLLKDYLDRTFPLRKGQTHEVFNGAIGGTDSSYFAFCGTHHIHADVDLIILEFDVNDQPSHNYQVFFDQLMRIVLELPSQPAVIILGAWGPKIAQEVGYGDPQLVHMPISHYYDVPYVSMKRLMFNHYLRFPHETGKAFWLDDLMHPNVRGHRILADLLVSYLESQMCQLDILGPPENVPEEETVRTREPFSSLVDLSFPFETPKLADPHAPPEGWEVTFDDKKIDAIGRESRNFVSALSPFAVPISTLFQPLNDIFDPSAPDPHTADRILNLVQPKAFCADANDRNNPMKPAESEGWEPYEWQGEKHYWVSDTPGARIKVDVKVNQGRIAVYYFRSQHYNLGDAKCWVDDNERGAVRLPGWWDRTYNVASVAYIDEKVTPGDHYVTCEILSETSNPAGEGSHHFRITAVMAT